MSMPTQPLFAVLPPAAKDNKIVTAAVGIISPPTDPTLFLIVHNRRGWDIPGGHLEKGESPVVAFIREVREETGCELLPVPTLIAILESVKDPTTGIAVFKAVCLSDSLPMPNQSNFVSKAILLDRYFGDKNLLLDLLALMAVD